MLANHVVDGLRVDSTYAANPVMASGFYPQVVVVTLCTQEGKWRV